MSDLPAHCKLISLPIHGDARGSLVALEQGPLVQFEIERIYYIFGTASDTARGFHAHRRLEQLAVCVSGACTMVLDDGERRVDVVLDRPDRALHIGSPVWREMNDFTPDCVLMVLASRRFEEADYIRDYEEFRRTASAPVARS